MNKGAKSKDSEEPVVKDVEETPVVEEETTVNEPVEKVEEQVEEVKETSKKELRKSGRTLRVQSGITGVDELIDGGFNPGQVVLLTGTTGTGKTNFSLQYLYGGVKKGDKCLYVSFEEPIENIKENAKKVGLDFDKMEKDGNMLFVRYDPFHAEDIYDLIESSIKKINATRVVIDSISALGLYVRDAAEIRRMIFNISLLLRKLNCTSVITSEILPMQNALSRFGVEEFVSDAIIVLYYLRSESQFARSITVWKMRGSKHSHKLHPYDITDHGIVVYPKEEAFVKM
ncbi:MAG: AAA family ATPase [Nanoarchaeota archaeon]|nr:AAA family ATPase [Nanoarchaeota archaeon]